MKLKKINQEYFYTIADRLTRFKPANIRYERVFDDLISKFTTDLKSKSQLSHKDKISLAEEIFYNTFESNFYPENIKKNLFELENKYFVKDEISDLYLNSNIDYNKLFSNIITKENLPLNIVFLKKILNINNSDEMYSIRNNFSTLYPVEKIILCEGQTEFILLKSIFKILNVDFNKNGILVIEAGGKSNVVKKYYKMIEYCKVPIMILLDKDGIELKDLILSKLRKKDKLYFISKGEFEDLLPAKLLLNAINFIHKNEILCEFDDFKYSNSMVKNLEEIYRKYGFGEFKKAHFANELNEYIINFSNRDDFTDSEIVQIAKTLQDIKN